MKTYHIKDILEKELLIVELPENKDIDFYEHGRELLLLTKGYIQLGKPDEISEDSAKRIVSTEGYVWNDEVCSAYVFHGRSKKCYTESAVKSLLSAIETVIFWDVNPLGDEPNKFYTARDFYGNPRISRRWSKWHEAESRTFDRNRTLIFVKN